MEEEKVESVETESTLLTSEEETDTTLLTEDVEETEQDVEKSEQEEKEEVSSEVPEKYEFKVPEGMELDTALVDKFTPVFKELGLSPEKAQKLVDAYAPYVKQQTEAVQKEALDFHNNQKEEWKKESMKFLGPKAKEELSSAARLIDKFSANKEEATQIREMLELSGLGNYPPMVRLLVNAGKKLKEDKFVESNKQNSLDAESSPEKYLYNSVPV